MTIALSRVPMADEAAPADPTQRIRSVMRGWSLEATLPTDDEIATLKTMLSPGAPVYVSAVPTRDPATQIEPAVRLAAAGFRPVPHVAVRTFASAAAFD